jgi:hypothetical protein
MHRNFGLTRYHFETFSFGEFSVFHFMKNLMVNTWFIK